MLKDFRLKASFWGTALSLSYSANYCLPAHSQESVAESGATISATVEAAPSATPQPSSQTADSTTPTVDTQVTPATEENDGLSPAPENKTIDYVAAAIAAALALRADNSPSKSHERAVIATDQYSVISPFPGGGYSIRPDGRIAPGGAMQVNIPIAYAPRKLSGVLGGFVAQSRRGDNLSSAEDRNGSANLGVGFKLRGRGAWVSRMILSEVGFPGGDSSYNFLSQLVSETASIPAIAVGMQDIKNRGERSPFVVATKSMGTSRVPLYVSLGVGSGRFAGSSIFGGVSISPVERLSLAAEYDGIQFNVGSSYALNKHVSVLASLNDIAESDNRPGGVLGRRFQLGATAHF